MVGYWLLSVLDKIAASLVIAALGAVLKFIHGYLTRQARLEQSLVKLADLFRRQADMQHRLAYQLRTTREHFGLESVGIRDVERDIRPLRNVFWAPAQSNVAENRGTPVPERILDGV